MEEALRMVSAYPAQVIGKSTAMGRIEKGFNASLVMLDEMLEVEVVVD
jgi:N-acetylglucosamine-6-phosphate deacetylase